MVIPKGKTRLVNIMRNTRFLNEGSRPKRDAESFKSLPYVWTVRLKSLGANVIVNGELSASPLLIYGLFKWKLLRQRLSAYQDPLH